MANSSFRDRTEAGVRLAEKLMSARLFRPVIFAIPKGGIPVARSIASRLGAAVTLAPGQEPEFHESTEFSSVTADARGAQSAHLPGADKLFERDVVIVDDVIANGAAAIGAIRTLRARGAGRIVVAAGVVTHAAIGRLRAANAEVCYVYAVDSDSPSLNSLDQFFDNESPASEQESLSIPTETDECRSSGSAETEWVNLVLSDGEQIAKWRGAQRVCGAVVILTTLQDAIPAQALKNVEDSLHAEGLGTLTVTIRDTVVDVAALSHRVRQLTNWLEEFAPAAQLPIAYFGIGLGAAAMLEAAAATPERIRAVVGLNAPLTLVEDFLPRVHAPTLLIVSEADDELTEANRRGLSEILVEKSMVTSASDELGGLVQEWITRFLSPGGGLRKNRPSQAVGALLTPSGIEI